MIMDATFLVKSKVADLRCRRQVIQSQPNNKRKRVMGNPEQNKKAIAENRKRIFFARCRGDHEQDLDICVTFDD